MPEPIELLDTDLAAETLNPVITRIVDQLVSKYGLSEVKKQLPIDVRVTIALFSGERKIGTVAMRNRVGSLEGLS